MSAYGAVRLAAPFAALMILATGCASYRPPNPSLPRFDPAYGYRPTRAREVRPARPLGDVLLVLAFSGGGTRAAALAYGVLQELRAIRLVIEGKERRLLDEVDVITAVSGGSFTAAYYGLFGERTFADYETRFLRRNVQRRLFLELFRPLNWLRLLSPYFHRSDLAVRLYDREIFDGATFSDLETTPGPFIQINATDLAIGNRFTFFQPQFDLICSDLSRLEVARAVAASSAVPVLFAPLTLRNYAGSCGFERPAWVDDALADRRDSLRRFRAAQWIESYLDPKKRRYIHLVDGGVADNLGLRGPLENVLLVGGIRQRFEVLGLDTRPAHVAVVVVNAEVHPEPSFNLAATVPGLASVLSAVSGVQIYSYNFETLELMRESMRRWTRELPPTAEGTRVQSHLVEVSFDALQDSAERAYFNALPTSFALDDEAVDRLIAVGRRLLRESPEYQALLAQLGTPARGNR